MSKPFNVRVYALLEHEGKILLINEPFQNQLILKFPGGGLEFGEGTRDCLVREFEEELNLKVKVMEHFYTQDFFQANAFNPSEQILLIYYKVKTTTEALKSIKILDNDIVDLVWKPIDELNPDEMTLAADKVVIEMFKKKNFES